MSEQKKRFAHGTFYNAAPCEEGPEEWKRVFVERLKGEPTANRVWRKIEKESDKTGLDLDYVAAKILFLAATMADSALNEIRPGLANQTRALPSSSSSRTRSEETFR